MGVAFGGLDPPKGGVISDSTRGLQAKSTHPTLLRVGSSSLIGEEARCHLRVTPLRSSLCSSLDSPVYMLMPTQDDHTLGTKSRDPTEGGGAKGRPYLEVQSLQVSLPRTLVASFLVYDTFK